MQVLPDFKYLAEPRSSASTQLTNRHNYVTGSVRTVTAWDIFARQIFLVKNLFANPKHSAANQILPTCSPFFEIQKTRISVF